MGNYVKKSLKLKIAHFHLLQTHLRRSHRNSPNRHPHSDPSPCCSSHHLDTEPQNRRVGRAQERVRVVDQNLLDLKNALTRSYILDYIPDYMVSYKPIGKILFEYYVFENNDKTGLIFLKYEVRYVSTDIWL